MWFIVNTNKFQEQKTKEFLENTYSGIVKLVYLPKCRMKYVDTKGEERFRFRPMICGLLFIKADSVKALKRILTYWGYFVYEDAVRTSFFSLAFIEPVSRPTEIPSGSKNRCKVA